MKKTNRFVASAAALVLVGAGIVGADYALTAHDRSVFAAGARGLAEAVSDAGCNLGFDPATGLPTDGGRIVSGSEVVTASSGCSADIFDAWTSRRLAVESNGVCVSDWAGHADLRRACLPQLREIRPHRDSVPLTGLRVYSLGGSLLVFPCEVKEAARGCEEWSR